MKSLLYKKIKMNVKISLPYNHRIQHTSPNEYSPIKHNIFSMRSSTNSLGYNLNFFDSTKAKMFFNRNPSFSKEKRSIRSSHTPKRDIVNNKPKQLAKANSKRDNAFTPVNNKISLINKRKKMNIKTDSPTFKRFTVYKNSNARTYNTNNNSKSKNKKIYTNRIQKINVYKTTNNTITHNNTLSHTNSVKAKDNKRNKQKKITPSKTFQPSLSQQNNLLMNKHKKKINDDIITADLISEQERKRVILHTASNIKQPLPGRITKIQTQRYNKGKQLSIDTNPNIIVKKEKTKKKSSSSYQIQKVNKSNKNNIRTNRINNIQIENSALNRVDTHNSNSINSFPISPNNLNSTGMRTCSQFKNRYKNLIETYLLSNSQMEDEL